MSINKRRLGKFYISKCAIKSNQKILEELLLLLAFIPYRVEYLFSMDMFEYEGISKHFDILKPGNNKIPLYKIELFMNDDKQLLKIEAKKVII